MYKEIDFTQLNGLPVTQDTFAFLQDSYKNAFTGITNLFGDLVIVSGVTDEGSTYSDGWVCISGELLPFTGGTKAANIIVEEILTAKVFADASSKEVWKSRTAKSASSGGNPHTSFVRLNTLKQVNADGWVVTARMADGSVTTAKIADGAVTTVKIADGNVTTAKIADSAVSAAKIAADAVTTVKIADANVTTAKIADNAVTGAKIPNGGIGKTKVDTSVAITGGFIDGSDADTLDKPGIYRIASNGPAGASAIAVITPAPAIGSLSCVAFQLTGAGIGDIYSRVYSSGSWGSWTLINDASA